MYFLYDLRSLSLFNDEMAILSIELQACNVMLQSAYLRQQSESAIVAMGTTSGQALYRCTEWRIVKKT